MSSVTDELLTDAIAAYRKHGSQRKAADELGISRWTLRSWLDKAKDLGLARHEDPAINRGMEAVNTFVNPGGMWIKTGKDDEGTARSVYLPKQAVDAEKVLNRVIERMSEIPPVKPVPVKVAGKQDLMTTYCLADVHFGMRAWGLEAGAKYDLEIASKRIREWTSGLVEASPASSEALILDVGDFTHQDDQRNVTPGHGHQLDVAGRFYETVDIGIMSLITAVEIALHKHERVTVRILPGNHNPHAHIPLTVGLYYRFINEPRVTVIKDPREHYCHVFGNNMIVAWHGDKASPQQMALALPAIYRKELGATTHHFLFSGHKHKHKSEDIGWITWEQLRAVTEKDAYAANYPFTARSEMQAITYRLSGGEACRFRVGPEITL